VPDLSCMWLVVFVTAKKLDPMVAHVSDIQNQVAGERVLNRERPGFNVWSHQVRVHRDDRTTTAGSARGRWSVPDQNRGTAIVNRRRRVYCSIRRSVPLNRAKRSIRPAPTHLTDVTRSTRRHQRARTVGRGIRRKRGYWN